MYFNRPFETTECRAGSKYYYRVGGARKRGMGNVGWGVGNGNEWTKNSNLLVSASPLSLLSFSLAPTPHFPFPTPPHLLGLGINPRFCAYIFSANARARIERIVHAEAQTTAGIIVASCILTASLCSLVLAEIQKSVFRS